MIRPPSKEVRGKARQASKSRLVVVSAVVAVCVATVCVYMMISPSNDRVDVVPTPARQQQKTINNAKPQKIPWTNATTEKNKTPSIPMPKTYRDAEGILRYEGGLRVADHNAQRMIAGDISGSFRQSIFSNSAERVIERIFSIQPGETFLGIAQYDEDFVAEYIESLKTPIIVNKDDPPDVAQVKRAMIDVKLEIADRMRAGETLPEILNKAKRELQRLAACRENIDSMLDEILEDGKMSEEDVKDYVAAANVLLEKDGLRPLSEEDAFIKWNIMLEKENGK